MRRLRWVLGMVLVALGVLAGTAAAQGERSSEILVLTVEGPVTPAMGAYLAGGLRDAEARNAQLVILRLDTPGGSVEVMGQLVRLLSAAEVPTLVYVWPAGGRAASAGTFVTLSADLAAMTPQTTIGAASVVGGSGQEVDETLAAKITNDLVASIRSQTARRGEEASDWAERAITEAIAANATDALEIGLIDFVARDLDDLLVQADGAEVELASGEKVTLSTRDALVREKPMSLVERLLHLITDPNIALLLVSLGGVALLYELYSPGGYIGGIFGIIATLLGFYSLGSLNANWTGLGLIVFALILFMIELHTAAFGIFAAGGIAAFFFGGLLLFQSSYLAVSMPLLVGVALGTAAFFALILAAVLRTRSAPSVTGREGLIGRLGEVRQPLDPEKAGMVFVDGELWKAYSALPLDPGTPVRVVALHGLTIEVEPAERLMELTG